MQIIHKKDDFLYTIFPEVKSGSDEEIIDALVKFYTYGSFKPKVKIEEGFVIVDIDAPSILAHDANYRKAIELCERGKYSEAKPIIEKLIEQNPTNSEYHRIMGQILSDEGDQEEAINCLIDALRWDSKNGWALLMMGNIFAKHKDDIETALKYYDQALAVNPNDNITMNNIGANLMQQGKLEEAKKYFTEALKINNKYPNTHYALGMIAEIENDLHSAFYSTIEALKHNKNKDTLHQNSLNQAFELAKKITASDTGKKIFKNYLYKLEFEGGTEIDIIEDKNIPTAAKIEFAENYNREKHLVKYNPDYPAVEHLIMHELVHLDFNIEARKNELNQLFVSTQKQKAEFIRGIGATIKKFKKMGISDESIADYCSGLFDGMNRQIFNTPIDLFIEDYLYNEYPELRPYQFLSLYTLTREGQMAVTDKKVLEVSPKDIISKSKVYNIVNALQYKELYGIDSIKYYQASPAELKQAETFYNEYKEYRQDKEPAEEYELVMHWAEDLKLEKLFELVSEKEYRSKRANTENILSSIENDPFDLETKDPYKEREMEKFQKSQAAAGVNMAVVMFMVDALQYFEKISDDKVKEAAIEIALQGTQGYRPEKKDYKLRAIPGKSFSGFHILAYYYVSFEKVFPDMLKQLQLPYDEEYKMALTLYRNGGNERIRKG